ncbi:beta-galactosidase, partial [bacterium]|nr:beta-galactosidase [bacterium]
SWASKKWRKDTKKALEKFIDYAEKKYGKRILGYHIASGTTEEWMMWGVHEGFWTDYSKPALDLFRKYLKKKYRTVENLRKAWKEKNIDFESASLPTKEERRKTYLGILRNPEKEQKVIDFYFFFSELVVDTICYFSKVVKEKTDNKKLAGTFYGYVFQLAGKHHLQDGGHLAIKKLLDCKYIDFLCSPTSYYFRKIKNGYSHFMSLTDSVKLHGKLWFDENDIRTYLAKGRIGLWGKGKNFEETLKLERREFANVISNGCGMWWFDMEGGWFDDKKLLKEISNMKKIADRSVKWDRRNIDEIAVVVDDKSFIYTEVGSRFFHYLIMEQLPEIGKIGAPVGFYLLDDIGKISNHKFFIFLNCFAPEEKNRKDIEKIKKNGNVLLWIYTAGLYRDDKITIKGIKELTGIDIKLEKKEILLKIKLDKRNILEIFGKDFKITSYGVNLKVSPFFYSCDRKAVTLGKIRNTEFPGFVFRDFKNWKSVYSSAPVLPAFLLREMAKMAGCHIFCEDDVVIYGNKSILSVVVNEKGEYKINLPERKKIYDLFEEKFLGKKKTFFQRFEEGETKLWKVI